MRGGPLTNIALALARGPGIAGLVKEVVLMGGAISGGNVDAVAEFNVYVDPEAARIVLNGGWPVTMVGLEIGRKALFTRAHLADLRKSQGPQQDFAAGVLDYRVGLGEKDGLAGATLYDPTAMAAVIDRTLITRSSCTSTSSCGESSRAARPWPTGRTPSIGRSRGGITSSSRGRSPFRGTHVATDIDAERFARLLVSRLSGR